MTAQKTIVRIVACVLLSICILPSSTAWCPFAFRSAFDSSKTLASPQKVERLKDIAVRSAHEPHETKEFKEAAVRLSKYPIAWDASKCSKKCLRKKCWKLVTVNDQEEAPKLLRALFHDHQACALDGSLRFEMDRHENSGLKSTSEKVVSIAYSCGCSIADTYALAAKFAVRVSGGPRIKMSWGHKDAIKANPKGNLPKEHIDAHTLRKVLYQYNDEAICLLNSAHNIGHGIIHKHGTIVWKPFTTNPRYFNNEYFKNLVHLHKYGKAPKGTFQMESDRALIKDDKFLYIVKAYAEDDALYRYHFKLLMELIIGDFTECNNDDSVTVRVPALR